MCSDSQSCPRPFVTPWTIDHQARLSMGFPWSGYWTELSFPPPGIEPESLVSLALAGEFFMTVPPGKLVDMLVI